MRNIFVEGVRSAFIRIIRMIVYIVIGLIIFYIIGLFTSKKAHALTYKDIIRTTYQQSEKNGYFLTGNTGATGLPPFGEMYVDFDLSNPSPVYQNDYILFRFNSMNFSLLDNSEDNYCSNLQANYSNGQLTGFTCSATTSPSNWEQTLKVSGWINYTDNSASACYMSSEFENHLVCPYDKKAMRGITVRLSSTYRRTEYRLSIAPAYYLYNADSTEIVNGLNGVQQQQQQTITIIQQQLDEQEQQNQYMQSDNVTSSMTSANSSFTIMTNEITQQLGSANELTQIVIAPVSMFMELATDSCSPLVLNVPFVNVQATIPCMKPVFNQYFSGLYTIFTTAISAIITYWVSVKTFSLIKDILDCDNDRIEVLDL